MSEKYYVDAIRDASGHPDYGRGWFLFAICSTWEQMQQKCRQARADGYHPSAGVNPRRIYGADGSVTEMTESGVYDAPAVPGPCSCEACRTG